MDIQGTVDPTNLGDDDRLPSVGQALSLLAAAYLLLALYLVFVLQFDFSQTDALQYWHDSLEWQHPFNPFHVPAYPLLVAVLRGLSLGLVPPLALMMGTTFAALMITAWLVYLLLSDAGLTEPFAAIGVLVLGTWPFVGVVYVVIPVADMLAIAMFCGGLLALHRSRLWLAALLLGLAMITHKAMWPFAFFMWLTWLCANHQYRSRQMLVFSALLLLPLAILWYAGLDYHGSPAWLFTDNLQVEISPHSSLPILDGVLGTMLSQGPKGVFKAALVAGTMAFSVWLAWICFDCPAPYRQSGIAIAISGIVLGLLLNQHEIWAVMRFGRLLALPLMWAIAFGKVPHRLVRIGVRSAAIWLGLLLLTQFVFAWYWAEVFSP
jgi:hypothetical protein